MKLRYATLAALTAATLATGIATARAEQDPFDTWVTIDNDNCVGTVSRSGVLLEVYVGGSLVETLDSAGDVWTVDGPATFVVYGYLHRDDVRVRSFTVPGPCEQPPVDSTTTTVPDNPTTTTVTTSSSSTTVAPTTTTTTAPPDTSSTVPPTTVPPTSTTSTSTTEPPSSTTSVPPTTNTPTVEIHCTGVTLGIEAGTWTVRIGDETREGFTVADGPRLVTFAAPLPPYRLVVTSGGDVLIDTTVKAEHVNDWPCEPATDDSSTGDELILPVTGPSDVLLALGALGTFLVVGGGTLLFSRAGKE